MWGHEPRAAPGRSGLRAPCGPREPPGARPGRRGPSALGSVRRRRNAEACHAGREAEGREAVKCRSGCGGALGPCRRLQGARVRAAAQRVFTFPLVERQCRHLSASTRHFRRRGSGSGCGSGVGAGLSHARGPPRSGWPRQRAPPRGAGGPALRLPARPDAAYLAVGAGNAWLCYSARRSPSSSARAVGSSHCGASTLDKFRVRKPGKCLLPSCTQ